MRKRAKHFGHFGFFFFIQMKISNKRYKLKKKGQKIGKKEKGNLLWNLSPKRNKQIENFQDKK